MSVNKLKITTLTPTHIGEGEELRLGFDFMIHAKQTYRMDVDQVLDTHTDWEKPIRGRYPQPGELLTDEDYSNPDLFRYVLRGRPRSHKQDARLQSCIKDVYDQPYIPGSSIKGAMRTALAWTGWEEVKPELHMGKLNRSRSWAGQRLERDLFGRDPNRDLLRALQVSDCQTKSPPGEVLMIANAQVVTQRDGASGAPIELETIRPNQAFTGSLHIDDSLFTDQANRVLHLNDRKHWLDELLPRVQKHSLARIAEMHDWFADLRGAEKIAGFYRQLLDTPLGETQALMQLGWGTGWDGKTFWTHLTKEEHLFKEIVERYRLDRAGRRGTRRVGDEFPKSKRAAMSGNNPAAPFGWVLVEVVRLRVIEEVQR